MNFVESQFWSIQNSASSKTFDILVKSKGHSYLFSKSFEAQNFLVNGWI